MVDVSTSAVSIKFYSIFSQYLLHLSICGENMHQFVHVVKTHEEENLLLLKKGGKMAVFNISIPSRAGLACGVVFLPHSATCRPEQILTAANLIRVVGAIHVVVALLVFANALAVGAGELVRGASHCGTTGNSVTSNRKYTLTTHHDSRSIPQSGPRPEQRRVSPGEPHLHTCSRRSGPDS